MDYAEAEDRAARDYGSSIRQTTKTLDPVDREVLLKRMADNLVQSPFSDGTTGFKRWAFSTRGILFLGYLSLRIGDAAMTEPRAVELICGLPDDAAEVQCVVGILECAGLMPKETPATKKNSLNEPQPTGKESSEPLPAPPLAASDSATNPSPA
jgi:hypothetical protein